jgi:diguanylate cyclase (GGDEF)-like protein
MSAGPGGTARGRQATAAAISVAYLLVGVALATTATPVVSHFRVPALWLVALLVPVYVAANRYSLDFEFRRESQSVTLAQLPLALGLYVLSPVAHLATRLVASIVFSLLTRQDPLKALYTLAAASFEVGAAAFAVGLVAPGETGPAMWFALYGGLLAGDVAGAIVLNAIWRSLGMKVSLRDTARTLLLLAPVGLLFTGLAIVAINAARVEALTAVVMLGLALWLALAYRAHRQVVAQQATTEKLYDFVRGLGPLTVHSEQTPLALERVRVLLHAERLELAVPSGDQWCHLLVRVDQAPRCTVDRVGPLGNQVAATRAAALQSRLRGTVEPGSDTMATPLMEENGLVGVLTASKRLGNARGFDMGDLRLLETVGAELSTALERGRLHEELQLAATTDPLTGLPNLADTTRRLQELLTEHRGGVLVATVAVDSFREVNDTLGHQVGDELLVEVTRRLLLSADGALVGRIGGGRFAVAVPGEAAGHDPEMFGLGLQVTVEQIAPIGPVGTHVRLSVGVVQAPEHGVEASTLLRRAETAMNSAANSHGGPVLWQPAYEVQGQRRLAVVAALREALATGALGVAYQPKLTTGTRTTSGIEALARWTHPALGRIGPDEFVPLAEASGLIGPLTTTILRQGLLACESWQRQAPGVGLAVNVSADTVLDPAFVTEVAGVLASIGVLPSLLTLELTEGIVVSDPRLAAVRMGELRELGVQLSVDDFGTGYSSLTYLKGLPVDEVKIAKAFIDGLRHDPADRAVVRAVVDIAHTLGMRVVAEGVEHEEQHGLLLGLGVDEVQGFLHATPMAEAELADWLGRRRLTDLRSPSA